MFHVYTTPSLLVSTRPSDALTLTSTTVCRLFAFSYLLSVFDTKQDPRTIEKEGGVYSLFPLLAVQRGSDVLTCDSKSTKKKKRTQDEYPPPPFL